MSVGAVTETSPGQFQVKFDALGGLLQRVLGGRPVAVDPYTIAQAILEVMRSCGIRAATGKRLLWNEYRMILAQADFARLWSLEAYLQRDLQAVLAGEAQRLGAELVGDLCVHVVADDAGELAPGHAVVRAGFAPTPQLAAPARGEMTVRFAAVAAGVVHAAPPPPPSGYDPTLPVSESVQVDPAMTSPYRLDWPGGSAVLALGQQTAIGRPHAGSPAHFVALTGAGTRINKQHIWIVAMTSRAVIGRGRDANPVQLDGTPLGAGEERELAQPEVEISLSRGELVLRLHRHVPTLR